MAKRIQLTTTRDALRAFTCLTALDIRVVLYYAGHKPREFLPPTVTAQVMGISVAGVKSSLVKLHDLGAIDLPVRDDLFRRQRVYHSITFLELGEELLRLCQYYK